ncbi:MAG: 16S rRNA (uracil(1498)-N(3))-methyltransferase [Chloroflexi bacterium]|nr:16S rRNA (uracil(1498)-N(3))-methyltransferase [Chloroflexota bacterium]
MHRFFVPPQSIGRTGVTLTGQQAHQIANVLRLAPGDRIVALDNAGWQYDVDLTVVHSDNVTGLIKSKSLGSSEPRMKITLFQGLLRAARFEFVLQKCSELGVSAFVPTICERCVVANIGEASTAKIERWQKIIVEAAEQSGRAKLPALQPAVMFQQACEEVRGLSFIAWEGEDLTSLKKFLRGSGVARTDSDGSHPTSRPFSVNIFIGPEGGFSSFEVQRALSYGIAPVSLGPRILRAETAAITATAVTLYETGDLGE